MTQLAPIAWFNKDPNSTLDYTFDWTDILTADDYIVDSQWITGGLTVEASSFDAFTTTAFLSGGTANSTYFVLNRITSAGGRIDDKVIQVTVEEQKEIYRLLRDLRLALGDIDSTNYRYLDKWLIAALLASTKALQSWWDWKYLVNQDTEDIYRNPSYSFLYTTPVIEDHDSRAIVLMACIIIKSGQLENLSWNLGAWRDAEISYSNIEGGRQKRESLTRDWDELLSIVKPPQKKLATARKGHLPGFIETIEE